ncbi:MAG: metal ABC transporter ATP-binding protein [Victivallales bacterium]|nr:metal ABC transporter ATP-binding protein [Victivallales bacterium]
MSASTETNAVVYDNLSVRLGGVSILENVSAKVPMGSSTAIIGPNGAGKTTMLLALLGEVPWSGGSVKKISFDGQPPKIGYVPQKLSFDRAMPITTLEFMVLGSQRSPLWFGSRKSSRDKALELLSMVHAATLANRRLGALSGGELQRVLLALALQQEPELLLLDEPASGVDFRGEHVFCELLENLRASRGFTQLMVSHDLGTVTHHATHVICLNRKVAAEGPPKSVLTPENLSAVFGIHMGLVDSSAMPTDVPAACSCKLCKQNKDKNSNA